MIEISPDEVKFESQEIDNTNVESESIDLLAGDEEQPILPSEENSEITPEWVPEEKVIDFSTSSVDEPVFNSENSAFPELDLSTLQPATER